MLVVLEGPDGSGKSTFAKNLYDVVHKKFLTVSVHHSDYWGLSNDDWRACFDRSYKLDADLVILDRCHISEYVYNRMPRIERSDPNIIYLDMLIHRCPNKYLFLPPKEVCLNTWRRRKDKEFISDEAMMSLIYSKYESFDDSWQRINYLVDDTDKEIDFILEQVRMCRK